MDKTSLGDRMKAYENIERRYLPKRAPLIVRIDGKAFHTYTKGFERPFYEPFLECMRWTAYRLCQNIEGAKLAYHQSDEISILITDDDTIETEPWFGKNLQKIVSISAAMATFYYNKEVEQLLNNGDPRFTEHDLLPLQNAYRRTAIFDARAFVLPREEVMNYFEWRQQDAVRNSIQAVGQYYFSNKELNYKSCNDIQNMLFTQKSVDWNNFDTAQKRGTCTVRMPRTIITPDNEVKEASRWVTDYQIPIFHEKPEYINKWVYHKECSRENV